MNLIDGTGKRVMKTKFDIAHALKGDTSVVETEDGGLVILYDSENGEIDINLFDEPADKFDINEIGSAVEKFLKLYDKHYGGTK